VGTTRGLKVPVEAILWRAGSARESFEKFMMKLKVEKNAKKSTISDYLSVLDGFLSWCRREGLGFKDWDVELVYRYVARLDNPRSRVHYLFAIKRFFKAMNYPDWKELKVARVPQAKLPDVLTEEEVLGMARACDNIRDRALILVTYESSRRLHEVQGLRIRDVKFDEHGCLATFHSTKSEDARIRLVMSASALQGVIEHHKNRADRDAYVFYGWNKQMSATTFRRVVRGAAKKAGLKRRVYPHLLRHSRIAKLKRENKLTDADIMNITGHRDRRQLDRYGKITMTMTNEKLLEIHGLKSVEADEQRKTKVCYRCNFVNGPLARQCKRCGLPLDVEEAMRLDDDIKIIRENLPLFLELLEDAQKRKADK